jgi:YhcH/YjgK/YiaL family protein
MKRRTAIYSIIWLPFLLSTIAACAQQSTTSREAERWFTAGNWKHGLKIPVHASIDVPEFARQYKAHPGWWNKAFAFMRDHNMDTLPPGHYVIDGDNVYADITVNPSTPFEDAKWHSHKKYCDIQYVIQGTEQVGVAPKMGAPVVKPFNGNGDSQFYSQDMKGNYYPATPASFFIFFPSNVHRPFIKVAGAGPVKRIRFKVRAA